jgi:uncharacterized protein (UPF0261 family)
MSPPTIVCVGMCNTKGAEIRHLAEQVAVFGGHPLVMDISLGAAVDWADVPLAEVLSATGTQMEAVFSAPRATAIELVGRAGAAKIRAMRAEGRCDGIISWAGSVGTTTATAVMRALPFGVPKVMLTDMASSDVSGWLGNKDIYIVNPTAEQGINVITRRAIANAAAAVVAMALVPDVQPGSRPLAAITSYGSTTPTVRRCAEFMESRGFDVATFHAVGVGSTMEDFIRQGLIGAIIDLTTAELMNNLLGSPYGTPASWEGRRLTAAADMGIPQVVLPGGLDEVAMGAVRTLPARLVEECRTGARSTPGNSGEPYQHNHSVTILTPTQAEIEHVSIEIASKLSASRGPTLFILPMRGWSAYDQSAELATLERGWAAGNGDGPTWQPDPLRREWSLSATRMLSVLREHLDRDNPNLDLLAADMHILDRALADLVTSAMGSMLDGTWRRGDLRDVPGVFN